MVLGIVAVLLLAPAAMADTCCANVPVGLDPPSALSGEPVRVIGMRCLNADNSGPLPLNLGAFWLSPAERPAEADPGSVPGLGLPAPDLPPIEDWLPFDSRPDAAATSGDATITVPNLPDGTYQLWWWCDDGSGPGGGIHYSTGQRLAVGGAPDTATEAAGTAGTAGAAGLDGWKFGLAIALGSAAFVLTIRSPSIRRSGG